MEILIRPDPGGTHASVRSAGRAAEPPAGAHPLRPGDSYRGIPYEAWHARLGQTVDVAALQSRLGSPDLIPEPWREPEPFPPTADASLGPRPSHLGDYGFIRDLGPKACTRDELVRRCARVNLPTAVWPPDSPWLQTPEEGPE